MRTLLLILCLYWHTNLYGQSWVIDAAAGAFDLEDLGQLRADEVNQQADDGSTALLWACHYNRRDAAVQLIRAGANPNLHNRYQISPLHEAARNGNAELIALLLEAGADAKHVSAGNENALMTAARTGRADAVQQLIGQGIDLNLGSRAKQTALMWAAAEGHLAVIDLLLKQGANPLLESQGGFTALMFAARAGHSAALHRLLEAGVDVNATTTRASSPKRVPKGSSALIIAIHNAHFELAAELLDAGADPNDLRSGLSPLHKLVAVRKPDLGDGGDLPPEGSGTLQSLELVEALLAHGANPNLKIVEAKPPKRSQINLIGATPLLLAAKTADLPYIKTLVQHGADDRLGNIDAVTPLLMAAGLGTQAADEEAGSEDEAIAVINYLIQRGANINDISQKGDTVMHAAAYKNFPKVVHHLNALKANITLWNQKNALGSTPLMIAQGFRPGNFKPSEKTEIALKNVMRANGITPPPTPPRTVKKRYLK